MHRALWEFRMRGVVTNLRFLDQVITHPRFAHGEYTTRFIDETPELFQFPRRRDRATRLLQLHRRGHRQRQSGGQGPRPRRSTLRRRRALPQSARRRRRRRARKQKLDELGPQKFAQWMLEQKRVLLTDTTHARRAPVAAGDAHAHARHGAHRAVLRAAAAAAVFGGMLGRRDVRRRDAFPEGRPVGAAGSALRAAHAEHAAADAAALGERGGLHELSRQRRALFRAAGGARTASTCSASSTRSTGSRTCAWRWTRCSRAGKLCEAAICYTGNLIDPHEHQVRPRLLRAAGAASCKAAGAHVLGIKDMAGLCQPRAAYTLVKALKEEIGLPVHFHTHDTSGIAAASVLAAIDAGADAVDGAMDAMSGLTSQPNLGSIVEALRFGPRDTGLDPEKLRMLSALLGAGAAHSTPRSRATFAPAPPRSTCTACPAGSTPTCASRRARSASRHRWPEVAQRLRRGERDVRRHRQGDAHLEGRGRHGADDGHAAG